LRKNQHLFLSERSVQEGFVTVAIEEQFEKYRPGREEYEVLVHAGGRTLQQMVKTGQGEGGCKVIKKEEEQ